MVGALRTAVVGSALALGVWTAIPQAAQAATTTTTSTTTPGPVPISFSGVAPDGTNLVLTADITEVTLSRFSPADPGANTGNPDLEFLNVSMTTDESAGTGPSFNAFDVVPASNIQLSLPDGSTVPAQTPGPDVGFLLGTYSFVVPASTTTATLEVAPGTVSDLEYPGTVSEGNGNFSSVTFQPASAPVVVPPPPVPTTFPTVPATTQPVIHRTSPKKLIHTTKKQVTKTKGLSAAAKVGTGAGGGLVVVLFVIPIWRRRAFRRADREGRVVFDGPPVPASSGPPPETQTAGGPQPEPAPGDGTAFVDVMVLGPVVFEGLVRPITTKPVAELLAFLALHPGRSFTTEQLRSAIWAEGRTEPKSDSFYTYVSALRRSLPPGSLVKAGTRFRLTEAVTSDWTRFHSLVEGPDDRTERLGEALALVRGPPFDGAVSGRNAPYAWSADLSHQMEVAVERAGHELAVLFLDSGDPVPADAAIGHVLRCVPASIVAREDYLRVGSLLGGPREVERRLGVARHAMGDDAGLLEPLVRELAGDGS